MAANFLNVSHGLPSDHKQEKKDASGSLGRFQDRSETFISH